MDEMDNKDPELDVPYFRQLLGLVEGLLVAKRRRSLVFLLAAYSEVTCRCIRACIRIGQSMKADVSQAKQTAFTEIEPLLTSGVDEAARPDDNELLTLVRLADADWDSTLSGLRKILALHVGGKPRSTAEDPLHVWYVNRLISSRTLDR